MDQTLPPRLPASLESAVTRVQMAARSAAEATVDSLGLAASATHSVLQRDALLAAQFELNRKLAIFALSFNETLGTDVARQVGTLMPTPTPFTAPASSSSWDSLTLVEDHEVEISISADRFALEIGHTCEWEIRDLDAYMGTLLGLGSVEHDRNPLRAEIIGQALIRAVEAVSDRPDVRKVLGNEVGRSLAHAMRQTYAEIVAEMRQAGVRPAGLTVRSTGGSRSASQQAALAAEAETTQRPGLDSRHGADGGPHSGHGAWAGGQAQHSGRGGFAPSGRGMMGQAEPAMMTLMRRITQGQMPVPAGVQGAGGGFDPVDGFDGLRLGSAVADAGAQLAAPNLILAYRDELRQATTGALDHMVIDVIASLFDQILSDTKVPPQMARQIARLQLPVLRAALVDNTFFSSRRHPVRRFINRIASLGTAVDDFDSEEGCALLDRVASLVQEVVDGDFEQISLYEQKLHALEAFIAAQSQAQVQELGSADALLARKETQLRLQHRYAQELEGALQGLPVPDYLRAFLATTWSQAIASAATDEGPDGPLTLRLREAGRELVMSVQPKGTPAHRQAFLRKLPQLMKDLNLGLDRIHCPDDTRRSFFAQLLPAHAESLRGQALSTLEHNLLAKQVDQALATPVPKASELPPASADSASLQALATPASFSAAEAQAVGLLDEAAVDWSGQVDINLDAEPEVTAVDIDIAGLPAPEPVEPMQGKSLADHVQLGFAYQMQLQGQWEKVRLAHVSAGRSFFVFTHGAKNRATVSLTHRMLVKLCDAGRLRALENAYLLERATARARRQLAELTASSRH